MHALFLASLGCGGSAFGMAFFPDFTAEELVTALGALAFLTDIFDELVVPLLLRFLLAEDLGASGDVDMSRSGSSLTATCWSFSLRFLFFRVPLDVFAALTVPFPFASGPAEALRVVSQASHKIRVRSLHTHHHFAGSQRLCGLDYACIQRGRRRA